MGREEQGHFSSPHLLSSLLLIIKHANLHLDTLFIIISVGLRYIQWHSVRCQRPGQGKYFLRPLRILHPGQTPRWPRPLYATGYIGMI